MRKILFCAGLMLALMAAGTGVLAGEEYQGAGNWQVIFDGSRMESNFHSGRIADAIHEMQPGDVLTVQVALGNDAGFATDWYMSNAVLSSLEDSQNSAEGGAYAYTLTYTNDTGSATTLYTSEGVGGERPAQAQGREGLHEATSSLEDFFYLDTLEAGGKGRVALTVALDGETQGNGYQDTQADLQMNFAVERSAQPESQPSRQTETNRQTESRRQTEANHQTEPSRQAGTQAKSEARQTTWANETEMRGANAQTGDPTETFPFALAALASGCLVLAMALRRRKKAKGGAENE